MEMTNEMVYLERCAGKSFPSLLSEAMDSLRHGELHSANPLLADVIAEHVTSLWYEADCPPMPGTCCERNK